MNLTDVVVQNLPAPPTGAKVYHDALTGLGVPVTGAGTKPFVLTYRSQRERVTVGQYPLSRQHWRPSFLYGVLFWRFICLNTHSKILATYVRNFEVIANVISRGYLC